MTVPFLGSRYIKVKDLGKKDFLGQNQAGSKFFSICYKVIKGMINLLLLVMAIMAY